MTVPDHKTIAYECENGHVNTAHKSVPKSADRGRMAACRDCSGRLTRKLIPLYECDDCGNVWGYTGDAERVTCPECKGKRTEPVASE